MSEPEKAISEICRVLKQDGILIALTFTAEGSAFGRLKIRFIEFGGGQDISQMDARKLFGIFA